MFKIGKRIIKTSLSVFLCFLVSLVRGDGVAFYSAIAAILCIQQDIEQSKSKGNARLLATLIGGIFGIAFLSFERYIYEIEIEPLRMLVLSVMIIPLIMVPYKLKKPASSYITCVVFLSITVSHVRDVSPYIFGVNRMLDTIIGVVIAIAVNSIHIPIKKLDNTLTIINLDEICTGIKQMNTKLVIYFNHILAHDASLMFYSKYAHNTSEHRLNGVSKHYYLSMLNDRLLYDSNTDTYIDYSSFDKGSFNKLSALTNGLDSFYLYFNNMNLFMVHTKIKGELATNFYNENKKLHKQHFYQVDSIEYIKKAYLCVMIIIEDISIIKDELLKSKLEYLYDSDQNLLLIYPNKKITISEHIDGYNNIVISEKEDILIKKLNKIYKKF